MADLKKRQLTNLEERRSRYKLRWSLILCRLKVLLDAEDKMYEEEFHANLETPEQVREKMAQRLFELKQRREQERQDEVNRKLEQRFHDSKPKFKCFHIGSSY